MRMGSPTPKQYLPLGGKPLLAHCIETLVAHPRIARVGVVLAPDNETFASYDWSHVAHKLAVLRAGGATRADSVAQGLAALRNEIDIADDDWVLVHDAARPGLSAALIDRLIDTLGDDPVGGLLALPIADTLKRATSANAPRSAATVLRDGLWAAQTPQQFRIGLLQQALAACKEVTDEASAIEAIGLQPKLVQGDLANLKVTYTGDLITVARLLGIPEASPESPTTTFLQ